MAIVRKMTENELANLPNNIIDKEITDEDRIAELESQIEELKAQVQTLLESEV